MATKPPSIPMAPAMPIFQGLQAAGPVAAPMPPLPRPRPPTVVDQAMSQYPILQNLGINFTHSPGRSDSYLEFWPSNEPGDPSFTRPPSLPMGKPGIEIYRNDTRPADIAGDVASHYLAKTDPAVKHVYNSFAQSLQPWQEQNLKGQYEYAKKSEGETRPYAQWRETSGLPAYFRGYAFQQWGPDAQKFYTPSQLKMFDALTAYLTKK